LIFVTVGTQLPFDRLIRTVDAWAAQNQANDVFAQIGPTAYEPAHIRSAAFITPQEFTEHYANATAVVAHAGMGTILTALEQGKPLLVMPRRADLGEHRNDHQMATAKRFLEMGKVNVAFDEAELTTKLDRLAEIKAGDRIAQSASPELIDTLKQFINTGTAPITANDHQTSLDKPPGEQADNRRPEPNSATPSPSQS
jgi:UDP-N-acetylglucosamine transferase subunit ALG13